MNLKDYLSAKGYEFKKVGTQDTAKICPFCGDERWKFACSPDPEKTVYKCHVCGVTGNLVTLKKHFNDLDNPEFTSFQKVMGRKEYKPVDGDMAEKYHQALLKNQTAFDYLISRGIRLETIKHFKLGYMQGDKGGWIAIPYYEGDTLINFKFRTMPPEKKFKRLKDAKSALFNQNCISGAKEIIITEGEFDAILCWQAGYQNVISGSNGASSFEPEWVEQLECLEKIYLWYDNDDPGREGLEKVITRLGIERCWIVQEEGFKDANEYFMCNDAYDFSQARQKKIDNVIHFWDSVFKIFEHEKNVLTEIKTPWRSVNRLLGGVEAGDLVILSAVPKTGKTTLALNIATHNAKRGLPVLFYCLEMRPERLAKKIIESEGRITKEEFTRDLALDIAQRIWEMPFYFGYNYKNIDAYTVFHTIRAATKRFGIKLIVFDNLHYLVRSVAHVSAEVGNVTRGFKLLAEELNLPIILIAQPRKVDDNQVMTMNDLRDSSSIGADSDQVIVLWREKTKSSLNGAGQECSFKPKTLVRVDASRYTPGGDTVLFCKGEISRFEEMERN